MAWAGERLPGCLAEAPPRSRELRRNTGANGIYHAPTAQGHMRQRREVCRPQKKLVLGSELLELVVVLLRKNFSPEQIAGKLRSMDIPSFEDVYVCRETIYSAVYALPVGELRKELIRCLRQGKSTRRPRAGGVDRRDQPDSGDGEHSCASTGD